MSTKSKAMRLLEEITGSRLTLGRAIRSYRMCEEYKQKDFAAMLGVTQSYLCDLENDRKEVSPQKAAEFARVLGESEMQYIRLALEDLLARYSLHYEVILKKVA